jgi:hypothetical protein
MVQRTASVDVTLQTLTRPSDGSVRQAVDVSEGQLAVGTFAAAEAVVFTLTGADTVAISVQPEPRELTFVTPPDYGAPVDSNRTSGTIQVVRDTRCLSA